MPLQCGVMPRAGGEWVAVTDGESYDDKPRWPPDGRALYFLSARDGSLNLWGRRFDPETGTVVGAPYRVTSFRGSGPARRVSWAASRSRSLPIGCSCRSRNRREQSGCWRASTAEGRGYFAFSFFVAVPVIT